MPLLGKKSYKPSPFPKDLKSEEEVFVIKETNEVFRSYEEYVNRIILFGFQVWSCQLTGKTNLKYAEAVACEEQALKRLESFPKYFEKPILQVVHHSSSGLQSLAQQCYKLLENDYFESEPVECCASDQWYKGKISRVHHESIASSDSKNMSSSSISPSSDKENSIVEKPQSLTEKNAGLQSFDVTCEIFPDSLKDVLPGDIKRLKKLPSVEMLKCFIRANTEDPWSHDNTPWLVKTDLAKKYSLADKLKDFTLIFNKKTTPKSKTPAKRTKSTEKPKKKLLDESSGHGKLKVNKVDPSQRKLDSFRKSTGDISKTTDKTTTSSVKLTQNALKKQTPVVKDLVECPSDLGENDDRTPSGQLRGTPIKCRLVLTPVKSPCKGTVKSPGQKMSGIKEAANKSKTNCVIIEDDTRDATTISCKTPKKSLCKPVNKLKKSPKGSKPKKASELAEVKQNEKLLKNAGSKSVGTVVIDSDIKEKDLCIKKRESEKKAKRPKTDTVQRTELVNLTDDSEDFVSSPKKRKVCVTPTSVKQSTGKMKQMTLLDLTKKTEDEKTAVPLSPKIKAKKQKTLSEMFSAALQKDKANSLNALIRKTAQEVSSPSNLALNLPTPQRDHVAEKWHAHQERLKWKTLSAEDKAKIKLERINLQRQLNGKLADKKKQEDHKLLNLKPLPPAKPVNLLTGISPESFSDVAMIAEFVHTFRDLLVPKETLHISIDNLSEALVAGVKGFALLSRILVIFLQILLQDSSTKGKELGMQLSEMPLTQQTASEVSRLYLSSKLNVLTAYEEDKQLEGILESLQHTELYSHTAEEKIKILVTLCHEVLSSNALDDYMGSQLAEATELRKEKMAKLKEKKDQQKEEKERLKREKEELQKQKEEEQSKKQLKMDDLNKKGESQTESSHTNSEAAAAVNPSSENAGKNGEQKPTKDAGTKKDAEEVSEVVKAMRKRREDMANKQENKLKEEKDRLEKEEEEQWNLNMAHCQYTKRLRPIGYDRNHARYWVFNGIAGGVYVEQGWRNLEDLSQTFDESSKEVATETDVNEQAPLNDDVEIVGESKDESKMDAYKKDDVQELRLPDIPYTWSCYDTEEEVQALLECLSHQGIRESPLRKSLKEQMEFIAEGIKRNLKRRPAKLETEEEGLLDSMKEELKDIAECLVHGNLAILGDVLMEYQEAVDNSSSVSELASQLEKLLPSVLPQFYQGMFSRDKPSSEKAKECWLEEVKKAATASRLHLLLGILDSTVVWDLSAENARCKICRLKGIGKTLILCDDCNLAFHLQCLRPALSEVPEGHWSCPVCKPNERLSSRTCAKNYKEGSSSEAEDGEEEGSEASLGDSEDSSSEDETDEHEDYCHTCGEDGDLICCDTCPSVFHTVCHQPPLRNIPRGAWSCWQCRQPKDKKQKKKLQGGHTSKSKTAKKHARQDESSRRTSKRKRSPSLSSEDSGYQKSSKRTCQRRQPIKIADDDSARGGRRKLRASIEDLSDDESFVGNRKASKSKQRRGKQAVIRNGSVVSRLRRRYPQDSEDEKEQSPDSNVKSFYSHLTRRTSQQKTSNDSNMSEDDDDEEEEPVTQRKKATRAARHPERDSRKNRHPVVDYSEDEDEDNETEEKENRKTSLRKKSGTPNSARRSTRNQRRVSSSSEPSDDDDDVSQSTNQRGSRNKRNCSAKQVLSSFDESDESGLNTSKASSSKSRALRDRCPEPKKSQRGTVKRQTQGRGGNRNGHEEGGESDDGNEENNGGKQRKAVLKNSSITENRKTHTRSARRTEVSQDDEKEKRRRVNVEIDACEQILRDLILHEESWPFTQPVNLREVPDYLEFVKTPMDLGTIRDKLKNLEYPDVESFVGDVRLVFSNSDKYNLGTSEVGKAGKNLEKYFDKLFKQIFSNSNNKSKIQRKR